MTWTLNIFNTVVLLQILTLVNGQESAAGIWAEDECRRTLREAINVPVKAPNPPKLSGHWTSSRCEVRPGPEFVLRKYLFRRTSFQAQLFYYTDETCSDVTHYIIAKGSVKTSRASWRTPGAFETRYSLSEVVVIPYTSQVASDFGKIMRRYCKQSGVTNVQPYKKFSILRFSKYRKDSKNNDFVESDFDCTKLFNFTLNELQLVRLEKRKQKSIKTSSVSSTYITKSELYLGDISTNMKLRRQYVPTHYQAPLLKSKTADCEVCRIIATNATQWSPPKLPRQETLEVGLAGDWVSQRCETRPNGQFLTRHLTFLMDEKSWQGEYAFYNDPLCSQSSFKIDVKGTYVRGERSEKIYSAYDFVFKTSRLKVTPLDFQTVGYLNSYLGLNCGDSGKWEIGVTKDVTSTNGCITLGITLPNTEYELIKTENENRQSFLYVGQRPSDFVSMSTPKNRPTSFQIPLVKCGAYNEVKEVKADIEPVYYQYSGYKSSNTDSPASTGIAVTPANIYNIVILITIAFWSCLL